jgi:AcrR family transcriptional regulator
MGSTGRPRSEDARRAILRAACELVRERGFAGLTIEGIASRARVGKTTIYRHWPNKAAVVMDALLTETDRRIPVPDTGSVREDLRQQLLGVVRVLGDPADGSVYVALLAEAQRDATLAAAIREQFIAARRGQTVATLERGIARGELPDDLNLDVVIDALHGALYYRLLVRHAPVAPGYIDQVIELVLPSMAAHTAAPSVTST